MFSLAYVILSVGDASPADAIAGSLARFERGRRVEVPSEWLRFHDETACVYEIHNATYTFTKDDGLRTEGGDSSYVRIDVLLAEMAARDLSVWTVRFADIEPNIDRFVERFLHPFDRHPVTNGFGHWLNGLGKWDWWELGGRFDGIITGTPSATRRGRSPIASRPKAAQALLNGLEDALSDALNQAKPEIVDVRSDANLELVATLRDDLHAGRTSRLPGVVVLPPTSVSDDARWLTDWPEIGSVAGLAFLGLPPTTTWRDVLATVYGRFPDHWAAAVAFHH